MSNNPDYMNQLNEHLQSLPGRPTANWGFGTSGPANSPTHIAYLMIGSGTEPVAQGTSTTRAGAKANAAMQYLSVIALR